jgi:hypothetical protein
MSTESSSRSVGAVILAIIAAIAGILAVIDVLRYLSILPVVAFGEVQFFGVSWIGAIMAAIVAAIWFWAANKLWNQDEQGWQFVVVIAIVYLIFDLIALISGTPLWALGPSILISGLALIIAFLPGTQAGFGRA